MSARWLAPAQRAPSGGRGYPQVWPARDHEYASRISVQLLYLGRQTAPIGCSPLDGWKRPNICVERLSRTLNYECVYLQVRKTGSEAKAGIRKWMTFCNHQRPHLALGGRPPAVLCWLGKDEAQPDQQVQRVA
ncbi:MAG: integrase core domain-containing protein [Roseovarius sp.]|nr:integrase core domain-containing protein [Roseovarius sp.]